jgi:FixJ family two-component response regulator
LHVVVVEDDPAVRQAIARLLSGAGHAVRCCESAEDLLASGWLSWASCLLLDVHLPGMDGLTLLSHVRQVPRPPGVVIMTADTDIGHRHPPVPPGVRVLIKPVDELVLLDALVHAVGRE